MKNIPSIIYYLVSYSSYPYFSVEISPCYLLPEGYIPINDWEENFSNNERISRCGYDLEQFILSCHNTTIVKSKETALSCAKEFVLHGFEMDMKNIINNRDKNLKYIEKYI